MQVDEEVALPNEMDFENDVDEMVVARSNAGILGALDRTSLDRLDPACAGAQGSEAPSKMRKVPGVAVDHQNVQEEKSRPTTPR